MKHKFFGLVLGKFRAGKDGFGGKFSGPKHFLHPCIKVHFTILLFDHDEMAGMTNESRGNRAVYLNDLGKEGKVGGDSLQFNSSILLPYLAS